MSLFAAFFTLLATPTAAAPARTRDSFDDVRQLCASLRSADRPAGQLYRVEVNASGFALGRYRAEEQELELDGDRPLRAAGNSLYLDLHGVDEVAFKATEAQRDQWAHHKQAGKLALSVVFEPSADGCRGSLHAHQARLAGSARSWQLKDHQGQVLAAADEDGHPLERSGGPRAVKVQSVAMENEAPVADEGKARLGAAQGALDACATRAQGAGSLVLSFAAKGGALRDVQVALDGLHDEAVAGCIAKALTGATLAGAVTGRGTATIAVE